MKRKTDDIKMTLLKAAERTLKVETTLAIIVLVALFLTISTMILRAGP